MYFKFEKIILLIKLLFLVIYLVILIIFLFFLGETYDYFKIINHICLFNFRMYSFYYTYVFLFYIKYYIKLARFIRENDINFFPPTSSKLHTPVHIWPTRKIWNCILSYEKLCNFIKILYENLNFFFVLCLFSIVFKFVFLFFLNIKKSSG